MLLETLVRKQLARRMHDGPTQSVAALAMRADLARRLLTTDPQAASGELKALEDLARRTAQDLRLFQFTLMPQSLEKLGLAAALRDLADYLGSNTGPKLELAVEETAVEGIEPDSQVLLFFIACEGAENAFQHAKASHITLKLTRPESVVILLEVEDDGVGFDAKSTEATAQQDGKYGLAILRARVKLLHGELGIESRPGRGCKLRVALPTKRHK